MDETQIGKLYENWMFDGLSESDVLAKVKELAQGGEDINAASGWSKHTPLHNAATYGHASVIEYLLDAGADVTIEDANRDTVLEVVCRNLSNIQSVEAIKKIIKKAAVGVDEETLNDALEKAASHCDTELLDILQGAGADLEHTHIYCYTLFSPLAIAQDKSFEELKLVFDYLIEKGIRPWDKDISAFEFHDHSKETMDYLIENLDAEHPYGKKLYEMNKR